MTGQGCERLRHQLTEPDRGGRRGNVGAPNQRTILGLPTWPSQCLAGEELPQPPCSLHMPRATHPRQEEDVGHGGAMRPDVDRAVPDHGRLLPQRALEVHHLHHHPPRSRLSHGGQGQDVVLNGLRVQQRPPRLVVPVHYGDADRVGRRLGWLGREEVVWKREELCGGGGKDAGSRKQE